MPRLKKHSQMLALEHSDSNSSKHFAEDETEAEDSALVGNLLKPVRMKYSQRVKIFSSKSTKQEYSLQKALQQEPAQEKTEVGSKQLQNFLNKFTDNDEDIDNIEEAMGPPKRRKKKQSKPEIKTSNRMFSNISFDSTLQQPKQEPEERLEIEINKKQKKEGDDHLMQKFQQKASLYKNKLEYKDLGKDNKVKRNMKEKLKSIKEAEQIDIVVEIPKIFAGKKSQVEAALFLKNNRGNSTQELTDKASSQPPQDDVSAPKDRRAYYQELNKNARLKKAETVTQSSLKDCFKKSKLDDQDYLPDLQGTSKGGNFQEFLESQYSKPTKINSLKQKNLIREGLSNHSDPVKIEEIPAKKQDDSNGVEWETSYIDGIQSVNRKKQDIQLFEQAKEEKKLEDDHQLVSKSLSDPAIVCKKTQKINRTKKKVKRSQFSFKDLIEVEAELSDDEAAGGPKHNDQQSESSDEDSMSSMIDNDVELNSRDKGLLHSKFVRDVIEEEERKYQQMRKKMEKKYLEEEERLRKRMEEAAKKNIEKEKQEEELMVKISFSEQQNSISCPTNTTADKEKNKEKLRQIEEMLIGKGVKQEQVIKVTDRTVQPGNKLSKLEEIENGILGGGIKGFKKADRNGFKNIQAHKKMIRVSRPKT